MRTLALASLRFSWIQLDGEIPIRGIGVIFVYISASKWIIDLLTVI